MGVALDNFLGVPAHALLTVPANPLNPDNYMNAPHGHKKPFDVVVMNRPYRPEGKPFPGSQSAIDTFEPEGGPTIARGFKQHDNKFWSMTTGFPQNGHLWPSTTIELDEDMTILFVARFDGSNSFLELNWRDASGELQTNRTLMTISNIGTFTNFYVGATGSSYTSALAIKIGALSENDIDRLREWGAEYLPPVAPLPKE